MSAILSFDVVFDYGDHGAAPLRRWVREVGELSQEFGVVCLGGGVAGEAIAVGLQDSGLTLAVVERELVGGECPYWGCIPSKTLLRSGETLSEAERARVLAASRVEWAVDFPKVPKRALWMARDLDDSRSAAAMEATGARLFRGEGKLTDLTDLLREAEKGHGQYEPTVPKYHWSDWYAGYIVARQQGKTPEEAAKHGAHHLESARG
jgi:hypothetical protein